MSKLYLFLIILGVVIVIGLGVYFIFFAPVNPFSGKISSAGLSVTEIEKEEAGSIGEVFVKDEETGEEVPLKTATMPPALFNFAGTVKEVLANGLIIVGDGHSFADNQPRELTILFRDETVTTSADRQGRFAGLVGLDHLTVGQRVLIESDENIRGKLKFQVNYLNILP